MGLHLLMTDGMSIFISSFRVMLYPMTLLYHRLHPFYSGIFGKETMEWGDRETRSFQISFLVVCLCVLSCVHVIVGALCHSTCGSQRTMCRIQFYPSTLYVPRILGHESLAIEPSR